jgi:hypothetical protein
LGLVCIRVDFALLGLIAGSANLFTSGGTSLTTFTQDPLGLSGNSIRHSINDCISSKLADLDFFVPYLSRALHLFVLSETIILFLQVLSQLCLTLEYLANENIFLICIMLTMLRTLLDVRLFRVTIRICDHYHCGLIEFCQRAPCDVHLHEVHVVTIAARCITAVIGKRRHEEGDPTKA